MHVDLKHLPRLHGQPAYVFVAIERVTRFVQVEIIEKRDAVTVAACLERFLKAFAHPVHTLLTDNGSEFTDRFAVYKKGKPPIALRARIRSIASAPSMASNIS